MDIGSEIRRAREARGWSQAKLAAGADMGVSGISQIETGARNPSVVTLSKIADALGIEVVDLFPKPQTPQPSLEDAAQSEALQEALAVLFQGLTRRGQAIVEQSRREGPSEALSREVEEYYREAGALHRIKGRRDIFGRESDDSAEAEAAYQEVEDRIQAMLRQDVEATKEERSHFRKFRDKRKNQRREEPTADAS
jgi:transcriptional regulator with XRE-family HTH domain